MSWGQELVQQIPFVWLVHGKTILKKERKNSVFKCVDRDSNMCQNSDKIHTKRKNKIKNKENAIVQKSVSQLYFCTYNLDFIIKWLVSYDIKRNL